MNCPSHDYNQKGTPQLVVKNCTFSLPDGVALVTAVNSNGIAFTNNTVHNASGPENASLFRLVNTPMLENHGNQYIK